MAKGELNLQQKKEYAQTLYFNNKGITNKEIARRVEVNEKTVAKWMQDGEWEVLRRSMLLSKSEQIARLYAIMEKVTNKIDDTDGGIGDTKLADMMIKYTAAINNLETDTSITEIVESLMQLGAFAQQHYPEFVAKLTEIMDGFVMEKLK